jgi:hypothetical protein
MKRKFKKWWSAIPPISTSEQSQLTLTYWAHKNGLRTTYDVGNPGPGIEQTQECGGVKPINGIPLLLITGSPTAAYINKQ